MTTEDDFRRLVRLRDLALARSISGIDHAQSLRIDRRGIRPSKVWRPCFLEIFANVTKRAGSWRRVQKAT